MGSRSVCWLENLDSLIDFNVDVEEYAGDLKINQD